MRGRASLRRFALVSIAAALLTISLKSGAYWLTGSVGLLSDALESLVNLVAAIVAFIALSAAARPEDEEHTYGHSKAEYFSSALEGVLILVAATSIVATAVGRLFVPEAIQQAGIGLAVSGTAALLNFAVARFLMKAGNRYQSITLQADAHHLMSDVYTSIGIIAGVGAAAATGWERLDPVIAILVALNIVRTGVSILRRSLLGLLDTSIPEELRRAVTEILDRHAPAGVRFHALRTRQAGAWRFIDFHVLVPGNWSVKRGHDLLEQLEEEIRVAVPNSTIFTHLEPIEDPVSFEDTGLERNTGQHPIA
ncbi:MAG: cation transporter [Gemmatimonadales bacterium]|nr:cation transporter [Gemmatimonadales bacterium]